MPAGLPLETATRLRSRGALVAAAVVLAFGALDLQRGGPRLPWMLALRTLWAAALVAAAWLVRLESRPARTVAISTAAGASVLALAGLAALQGGHGPAAVALLSAPFYVFVLAPDELPAIGASGGLTVASAVALVLGGVPPTDPAGGTVALAITSSGFAVVGAVFLARVRRAELELVRERADARAALDVERVRSSEAIAASERRRAEAERLAAAARAVPGFAHDVAGPLGSIRANVEWLRETEQGGRLAEEAAEVREVLADTRACLERISAKLGELRAVERAAHAAERPAAAPPGPARE